MFGPEYYTAAAYLGDGAIYCPECWKSESPEADREAEISEAMLEESFSDGCTCDGCGKILVDFPEEEEPAEQGGPHDAATATGMYDRYDG